jgi:hypothetical protein
MPLSRFTQTFPLACAAATSELESLGGGLTFLEAPAVVVADAGLDGFTSGVEAGGVGAEGVLAGSAAESVVITFLLRRFFLVVSDFTSLDVACALARTGKTTIVSSTQSTTAHRVRLRLA